MKHKPPLPRPPFLDSQRRVVWRYVSPNAAPEQAAPPSVSPDSVSPQEAAPPTASHEFVEPKWPGWQSSSYDLKHGLDVVELPTSLPRDVLDRLFNEPR